MYQYPVTSDKLVLNSVLLSDRMVRVLVAVERPRIILYGNVFTDDECQQLIEASQPKLERSQTISAKDGSFEIHEYRTSRGTFFNRLETPIVEIFDQRLCELAGCLLSHTEDLQVLNYGVNQEYKPHHDYFPDEIETSVIHKANGGQRIATMVAYLNDVEFGGDTVFPYFGISIKPVKGSVLYFENCDKRGNTDVFSLHGGAPIVKGEKWIATKWVREREFI